MINVAIMRRYVEAGELCAVEALAVALQARWEIDAHFTQYSAARRLSKATIVEYPMLMVCAAFDYDCPNHEPSADHFDAIATVLERLPSGCVAYFTANGFRVVTQLPHVFRVDSQDSWERWRAYHAGLRLRLDVILNDMATQGQHAGQWLADPSCDDPSRLFRLPNVRRKGSESYPELIGTLGSLSWEPVPVEPHAATECEDGDPERTIVGLQALHAQVDKRAEGSKLIVVCPWASNHTTGSDEAVVFHTADGMGKFHCSHNGCSKHSSLDALRAWGYDFGDAPEPDPPKVDASFAGPSDGSPQPSSVTATQSDGFLDASDLAKPRPPVEWLVPALEIGYGRPPLITSDPGAGKTWATQALALSVAAGIPLFGAFEVKQGSVLHVSIDSGVNSTVDRYQKLARGMGLELATLPLRVCTAVPPMVDRNGVFRPEAFKAIEADVQRRHVKLVIFDSLSTICAGLDENSTEIAGPLAHTKDDLTCCLWTHHNGKAGGYRGSSAIRAAVGAWWSMSIDEVSKERIWTREKASEDHVDPEPGDTELLTFRTRWETPAPGANRVCVPELPNRADYETTAQKVARLMLEALHTAHKPLNQTQLVDSTIAVKLSRTDKLAILGALVEGRTVRKEPCGKSLIYMLEGPK